MHNTLKRSSRDATHLESRPGAALQLTAVHSCSRHGALEQDICSTRPAPYQTYRSCSSTPSKSGRGKTITTCKNYAGSVCRFEQKSTEIRQRPSATAQEAAKQDETPAGEVATGQIIQVSHLIQSVVSCQHIRAHLE